jgi:hypothetical protein
MRSSGDRSRANVRFAPIAVITRDCRSNLELINSIYLLLTPLQVDPRLRATYFGWRRLEHMGQPSQSIRDLVVLARALRQYGGSAALPTYGEKLFRAAAEIEARISLLTNLAPQDWPAPEEDEHLHRSVDLKT